MKANEGSLKKHKLSVHGKIRNHQCDSCEKSFQLKSTLTKHMKVVHMKTETKLQCHICNQQLSSKYTLKAHISTLHENVKQWKTFYKKDVKWKTVYKKDVKYSTWWIKEEFLMWIF